MIRYELIATLVSNPLSVGELTTFWQLNLEEIALLKTERRAHSSRS